MAQITHPFSRSIYEPDPDSGGVRVTTTDGRSAVFTATGVRLSGAKIDVDPQMCVWVGQPRRIHNRVKKS